jgi:hypothetical protein
MRTLTYVTPRILVAARYVAPEICLPLPQRVLYTDWSILALCSVDA